MDTPMNSPKPRTLAQRHRRLVARAITASSLAAVQRGRGQDELAVCTEHSARTAVRSLDALTGRAVA